MLGLLLAWGPAVGQSSSSSETAYATIAADGSSVQRRGRFQLSPQQHAFVESVLAHLSLEEKIGQMVMRMPPNDGRDSAFRERLRSGGIGAVLNVVDPDAIAELQAIAVDASPHGIPLLFARDVIHGFRTIFPLPLGQAASFDPDMVEAGARVSAREAASVGLRWNFAPMIDVARDPRWGRIAESFGEDPVLTAVLGQVAIRGYQYHGDSILMAATAKHFAGYGAVEGGRDYNSVDMSIDALHNVYLPPFKAAVDAGVMAFMPSFSALNGVPASANRYLFKEILRAQWGFEGAVVSDWGSIDELIAHGAAGDARQAAFRALGAGIDQDMMSRAYPEHLPGLLEEFPDLKVYIDSAVRNILSLKVALNLFEHPLGRTDQPLLAPESLELARAMVHRSTVLLQNRNTRLPLAPASLQRVAVIGPLADDGYEQLGTWVFDGKAEDSQTPLQALRQRLGRDRVRYVKALANSRDKSQAAFGEAVQAAATSDVALLFLGEEAILHGEAHSRASLRLPGAQEALLRAVSATGTPVVVVVMAGRPLVLEDVLDQADAWLYAWAPGTMGGPGLADLILGDAAPSGHLPVTFPRHEGQIPVYHAQRTSGRPATDKSWVRMEDIPERAFQTSLGNTNHYLDVGFEPAFPFGFGLTYTDFEVRDVRLSTDTARLRGGFHAGNLFFAPDSIVVEVDVKNTGSASGETVLQLYCSDPVARVTRPERRLFAFQRIALEPGTVKTVRFAFRPWSMGYAYHYDRKDRQHFSETGLFRFWIGFDANAEHAVDLEVVRAK